MKKKNNIKLQSMDNYAIAENFSLLSKLMDIHGEILLKQEFMPLLHLILKNFPTSLQTLRPKKLPQLKELGKAQQKNC